MEIKHNLTYITTIFFITLVGIFGNILNLRVFSKKNLKRVETFRYFFCLAIIDIFLLITWFSYKFLTSGFTIIPRNYSEIVFKIISFTFNLLSQMNNWTFTAANINKTRMIIKESNQEIVTRKNSYLKVTISIGIILFILNLHYLIFFDYVPVTEEFIKRDPILLNESHQVIYQYIIKPKQNFSKNAVDLVLKNTNLLKTNKNNPDVFEFHFENYDYDHAWYKIRAFIRLIMFDLIPSIINLMSTFIIYLNYKKMTDRSRKKFNKQLVILFTTTNILFICDRVIKSISTLYFKFNEYQLECFLAQMTFQILSSSRHVFSFCIYIFTMRTYRSVIIGFFIKKDENENIQTNQISLHNVNNSANINEIILKKNSKLRKSISQFLSVDEVYFRNSSSEEHQSRGRSKSLDAT